MNVKAVLAAGLLLPAATLGADDVRYARFIDENLDRTPQQTVIPEYPHVARRDRIEGEVRVCFHIDRKGRPYRVAVRESTHRIFERPARRAVRASRWVPLTPDEEQSPVKACRTFKFELTPIAADAAGPQSAR